MPPVATGRYRDAEHARLAVRAEELMAQQSALLEDPGSEMFRAYVAALKVHLAEVAAYVDQLPSVK